MIKKVLLGLVAVFGILLIAVALQPAEFKISREMTMNASPEVIFPYINNSKKADAWMPWGDSDPQMKMTYQGPEEGQGSGSAWDGPGEMGTGSALVVESIPNQRVKTKLTYTRPFEMEQMATISLVPGTAGTKVVWEVEGKNNFIARFLCLFMNMDDMVGKEFEKGLSKLKLTVEGK